MSSSHIQPQTTTTICSFSLALICTFLAIAAIDIGGAAASDSSSSGVSDDGKLMLRVSPFFGRDSGHAIATRSNFLRFGKRSPALANLEMAPISEDGDDGDVNEAFEMPIRRDYREFVRFGKRGGGGSGGQMASTDKRGQDYLRFGKKADYLRFGKRADYLRFGKREYDGEDKNYSAGDEEDLAKRQLWKRFSRLQRSNDFLRFG